MPRFKIRTAERPESATLTALMLRPKAHWGYDADFMLWSLKELVEQTS